MRRIAVETLPLFPSLDFCDSVQDQSKALGGNEPRFRTVMSGLRDLQNYCDSWDTGKFVEAPFRHVQIERHALQPHLLHAVLLRYRMDKALGRQEWLRAARLALLL